MAEEKKEKLKTTPPKAKKSGKPLLIVKDGKVVRRNPHCPKCGVGFFLAVHEKRKYCGSCHYTEFVK